MPKRALVAKEREWSVPMKLTFRTHVLVKAETPEDARQKANDGDWVDQGLECAECSDWIVTGPPKDQS